MSIKVEKINKIIDNKEIYIYSLSNENGLTARIMNYGGVILSLPSIKTLSKFSLKLSGFILH